MQPSGVGASRGLTPDVRVRISGQELAREAVMDIVSLSVEDNVDEPSMFTLRMTDWDETRHQVTWMDSDQFSPGSEVEIALGYVDHLQAVFKGEITGLEPEFHADHVPMLTVRGYDRRHRLMRGRKSQSFSQMSDSDIAAKIAGDAGLTPQTDATDVTLEYVLQHNQTDLEFLLERADPIGYEVFVDDRTLHFRKRNNTSSAVLTVDREGDLIEFTPRLTTMGQVTGVAVQAWDVKNKAAIKADATSVTQPSMGGGHRGPEAAKTAFGAAPVAVVDRPLFSQAQADQIAQAQLNTQALAYLSGEGMCIGRTELRAGIVITLTGLGRRFSGDYYVIATQHTYDAAHGYRTGFNVRRNSA